MFIKKFKIVFSILEKEQRTTFFYLMLLTFFAFCLEVVGIGTLIPVLNLIARDDFISNNPWIADIGLFDGSPSKDTLLIYLLSFFVFFSLVKSAYLAFLARKQSIFAYSIIGVISTKIYNLYLNRPYSFFLSKNSNTLIRNTIIEVNQLGSGLMNPLLSLITEVFIILAVSFVLIIVEPIGYIVTIALLGTATLLFVLSTKKYLQKWGARRQKLDAKRLRAISESFQTIKELKLLHKQESFISNYKKIIAENIYVMSMNTWFQNLPRIFLEFVSMLGLCTLIMILLVLGNNFDSILATMGLFTLAIFRVLPSLNRISTSIQSIRFSMASIDVIAKEFNANSKYSNVQMEEVALENISFNDEVTINNLSYAFQSSQKNVLENINLRIKKNTSVGIIGETGSGKSTLINLLLGLLEVSEGEILIDGISIDHNLKGWQKKIGYVAQDIILLDSSIKRNIAFGEDEFEIDDERVIEVIKIARLEKFIEDLPDGIDTLIGENGARLSGGQRQRLGIARALYRESEVIILDEATSALDNKTELEFMQTINSLSNQKTFIIIAHRLSTLNSCDLIFKLEDGRVVSSGSAKEMLNEHTN